MSNLRNCLETNQCIDQIFVVNREDKEKLNMEFKTHESGLHFYNPTYKTVELINKASVNKKELTKRKLTVQRKQTMCMPNSDIHQLSTSDGF